MVQADTNRVRLGYVEEVTYGVNPGTQLQDLRFVSESLKLDTRTIQSNEIRSSRDVSDIIRTGVNAEGDIAGELSYGTYDDFLQWALMASAWAAQVTVTGASLTIPTVSTITRAAGSWITDGIVVGGWIKLSGMTTAGNNNSPRKVTNVTALTLTVSGPALTVQAGATTSNLVQAAYIRNGTTPTSMTIEKEFVDLTDVFEIFTGMMIDSWDLNVSKEAVVTTSFGFIGRLSETDTVTQGTGTNATATTSSVMNTIDNVPQVQENLRVFGITAFSAEVKNNLRARTEIGTLGAISVGTGSIECSGSLSAYLEDSAAYDRYLSYTTTSLSIALGASNLSGAYIVDIPSVKFTSGQINATGRNGDVMVDLEYEAFLSATFGYTIQIARFS